MALTQKVDYYEAKIGTLQHQVWEKTQVIGTQQQAIEAGILEVNQLKALNLKYATQITKIEGQLQAAKDSILLPDSIFVTDTIFEGPGEGKSYVQLPFSTGFSDDYIGLDFGIKENKTAWFDLDAPIKLDITLGNRKSKPIAAVSTPSPYVRIMDFNVVNIQEEKWYMKPWIPWAGGAAGGLLAGWAVWGR
jgi:hypothetical protein